MKLSWKLAHKSAVRENTTSMRTLAQAVAHLALCRAGSLPPHNAHASAEEGNEERGIRRVHETLRGSAHAAHLRHAMEEGVGTERGVRVCGGTGW